MRVQRPQHILSPSQSACVKQPMQMPNEPFGGGHHLYLKDIKYIYINMYKQPHVSHFEKTTLLCCMLQFSYRIWVSVHHLYKFHLISSSISFFGMIRLILVCKFWGVWLFAGQTCSQQIKGKRFKGVQRRIIAVTCHFRLNWSRQKKQVKGRHKRKKW